MIEVKTQRENRRKKNIEVRQKDMRKEGRKS